MNNNALAAQDDSFGARFGYARSRLAGAQKPTASTPAYLRFVNRKAGGLLAAVGYALRLSPTQVTLLSSAASFSGIALLILHRSSVLTGIVVSLLLLLGYALDSADGQLARVRGGGSKAGEWLDHVADIAKISSLHSAVAIAMLRYFELDSLLCLALPVIFLVANVTQFFGMMLRDKLTVAQPTQPGSAGSSSLLVAFALQPLDHGSLALAFLVLGAHTLFLWCYGFLALCTALFAVRSLTKAYRRLLHADSGAADSSTASAVADPTGVNPTGVNPAGVNPTGVNPTGVNPAGVSAAGAAPATGAALSPASRLP